MSYFQLIDHGERENPGKKKNKEKKQNICQLFTLNKHSSSFIVLIIIFVEVIIMQC